MLTRLQHFLQDRLSSLGQYLGAYIIALYTAIIRILYIYYEPASSALSEILLSCGFVFPLMVTSSLILQIIGKKSYWNIIGYVIVGLMGIGFYSYIHYIGVFNDDYSGMEQHRIFVVLSYIIARGSLLGGIAYSTYKISLQTRGWLKELVINMLIAVVSSLILRGGLSASIGSVDYLFDIDIYYKRYQYIGVISFLVVGVSILLTNLTTTKQVDDYPKIFRFFGLYIFLPLAIVYAVILMSYGAKIVVTQTWPKGLISWMVIGYTIRCTIVYFLTYPLQNLTGIKKIHTGYFVSILVFLPLLVGAIRQRIAQYGITEDRYLIVMIAVWIAVVGGGSLLWRARSWLLVIGGLLILAISSVYTPWSATSVSLSTQKNALKNILIEQGFYDGSHITSKSLVYEKLDQKTQEDLSHAGSIASYIMNTYGEKELFDLYTTGTGIDIIKSSQGNYGMEGAHFLMSLGLTGDISMGQNIGSYYGDSNDEIGFYYNQEGTSKDLSINGYTTVKFINSQSETGSKIDLSPYAEQIYQKIIDNPVLLTITTNNNNLIVIKNLNGMYNKKTNTYSIDYYSLMVFTK